MNKMCCCEKIKFLGCLNSCSDEVVIQGGAAANVSVLNLERGNTVQRIAGMVQGDDVVFEIENLNTGYTYQFSLEKIDGTKYIDSDGNDCFAFDALKFYS